MPGQIIGIGETRTRRQGAYDRILSAIIFGDLPPSSSVDEKKLARAFNLGIAAVRDALYRLSLEGLIERQPRIGTRIPDLGLRELQDVFEARVMLEGSCAALAAQRASPEHIAAMRAAFVGYEEAIRRRDFRRLVLMDVAFHRVLGAASHNKQIEKQVTLLHNNASRFWYFGLPRLDPVVLRADIAAHLEVVDAVEARDAARAEQAMRAVLGHFPESVRLYLTGAMSIKEERSDVRSEVDRREHKRPPKSARAATGLP
jgi:GntR family transcriptional regulator, rspAB operon transcriptional repressor